MKTKEFLKRVMSTAWMLVRKYGFTMSEALRQSWAVMKLRRAMKGGIVKFLYTKLDGTVRTAWGTLEDSRIPQTQGTGRKPNETLCTYYDSEKESFRSFKIANFLRVA